MLLLSLGLNVTCWLSGHDTYFRFDKLCLESCRCQSRTDKGKTHGSSFLTTETTYFYETQWHILNRYTNEIFHWVFHTKVFLVRREKGVDMDESMPTHSHLWNKQTNKQKKNTNKQIIPANQNQNQAKQNFQNVHLNVLSSFFFFHSFYFFNGTLFSIKEISSCLGVWSTFTKGERERIQCEYISKSKLSNLVDDVTKKINK